MMIKPTPGRIVYYFETGMKNPFPAMVTEVVSDRIVHLQVFTTSDIIPRPGTQLIQDDETPISGHWCEWMPYQKDQAAKHVEPPKDAA